MKQIEENPYMAISGDWFTAHGKGVNLGWFCADKNRNIAKKLREAFKEWIDNGHNNFDDELRNWKLLLRTGSRMSLKSHPAFANCFLRIVDAYSAFAAVSK